MDINAINTLISKAYYNEKNVTPIRVGSYDENTVGVTVDGFVMWFIPEKLFIFDADKLRRGDVSINAKRLVFTTGIEDEVRTNELIQKGKTILSVIKNENVEVFVDMKLLKVFDKNAQFKVRGPLSAVLVYENDILVGLVCPTKYTREA